MRFATSLALRGGRALPPKFGWVRINQKITRALIWTIQAEFTSEDRFLETGFLRLKKNKFEFRQNLEQSDQILERQNLEQIDQILQSAKALRIVTLSYSMK